MATYCLKAGRELTFEPENCFFKFGIHTKLLIPSTYGGQWQMGQSQCRDVIPLI